MPNLTVNGDFEQGNNSFSSSYSYYTGSSLPVGSYAIDTDPSNVHTSFPSIGDHTSGSGQMMIANSSSTANVSCWTQTVNIAAHSNANLSFFTYGLYDGGSGNDAEIDVYINGEKKSGGPFVVDDGAWKQFI